MALTGVYRAKAAHVEANGALSAFVPQVFGDSVVTITESVGSLPGASVMGWVSFHGGNPDFPVWMGSQAGGGPAGITEAQADLRYVMLSGGTMLGPLVLQALAPTVDLHAAPKGYVDTQVATRLTEAAATGLYVRKVGDQMTGPLTLPNANPTHGDHAARKAYVDAQVAAGVAGGLTQAAADLLYINVAGDTMNGALTLSGAPTNPNHAATKTYVDTQRDTRVAIGGDSMTGFLTLHAVPSSPMHAATKSYVDSSVFIPDIYEVTTQAQMLALPATRGDYALRSDVSQTFILKIAPATVLANWAVLPSSAATEIAAHEAKADPHTVYLLKTLAASTYTTLTTFNAHLAAADPHPVYATDADLSAHVAAADPHPVYSTDADLAAHVAHANPHPTYHDASLINTGTLGDAYLPATITSDITGTAAAWTTARTLTLAGDATGVVTIKGDGNVTLTVAVADDSHLHDGRYYTETESDTKYLNASNITSGTLGDAYLPATITSDITGTAAAWTTARTITLIGGVTGNVAIKGDANVSLSATVSNDSHTHDTRYYTETESDLRFLNADGDTVSSGTLAFGARLGQHLGLWGSAYGIGIQSNGFYQRTNDSFYWYRGGIHNDGQGNAGGGSTLLTLSDTLFQYKTFKVWTAADNGHGFGINADRLDDKHATDFADRAEMEALLGDLLYVGVYDAHTYDGTNATKPSPDWAEGPTVYRHGMYWVCTSQNTLNFIDSDYSGRFDVTTDNPVTVSYGDWVIATDPNVGTAGFGVDLALADVIFQYIPFSAEQYVNTQLALHTDPLRSPDPHSQYLLPAEADTAYAPSIHTHDVDIRQAIIDHQTTKPWGVSKWSWLAGILSLSVDAGHNLLPGSYATVAGVKDDLNTTWQVLDTSATVTGGMRVVRIEKTVSPSGYPTPGTEINVSGTVVNDPHVEYLSAVEADVHYAPKQHVHPYEALGAVALHEAKTDPHPTYLTSGEGDVLYSKVSHLHDDRYSPFAHTHPAVYSVHPTDGANSADIWIGSVEPTPAMGLQVGDLWIDTANIVLQKPSAPTNFAAAAGLSGVQIQLSWSAWPTEEGVTSILLERSPTGAAPWTTIRSGSPSPVNHLDTGPLTANTLYYYQLTATNSAGAGAATIISRVSPNTPPTAPAGVVATAPAVGEARLAWTPVAAHTYEVFMNGASQGTQVTPFVVTGQPENTQDNFGVRSFNQPPAPNVPLPSPTTTAAVVTQNVAPPILTGVTATSTTSNQVSFSWNASPALDIKDYRVRVTQGSLVVDQYVTNTNFTFGGLTPSTPYSFIFNARDTGLLESPSVTVPVSTPAVIVVQLPPIATVISFGPQVTWGKMYAVFSIPAGVTQYRVDRSIGGTEWTIDTNWTDTTTGTKTVILNGGLIYPPWTDARCRVYTKNAAGATNYVDYDPYWITPSPTRISASGTNHWRNLSGGQWNGSSNLRPYQGKFDAVSPNSMGFWFYGTRIQDDVSMGGRETLISGKITLRRTAGGLATGASPIIQMHSILANPGTVASGAGTPTLYGAATTLAISLTPTGGALQATIPLSFVQDLVNGVRKGIAVYDADGSPYMCYSSVTDLPTSGEIEIAHLG